MAASRRRRLEMLDCHPADLLVIRAPGHRTKMLRNDLLKELADFLALGQGDDGLLPVGPPPPLKAHPPPLAPVIHGVHPGYVHIKNFLDGGLDFRLGGLGVHDESVLALLQLLHAFFGDDGADDDLAGRTSCAHGANTSSTAATASRAITRAPCRRTA